MPFRMKHFTGQVLLVQASQTGDVNLADGAARRSKVTRWAGWGPGNPEMNLHTVPLDDRKVVADVAQREPELVFVEAQRTGEIADGEGRDHRE